MDLGINNNNLSFQANIVTNIKGRNDIMEPVMKEFSKLTRKMEGDLYIDRPDTVVVPRHTGVLEFSTSKGPVKLLTSAFHDLLATPPEKADNETINSIAKELATMFKALNRQNRYVNSAEKQVKEIGEAKRNIVRVSGRKRQAQRWGHHLMADLYEGTINKNKKKADKAAAELEAKYSRTRNAMDKYEGRVIGNLDWSVPEPNDLLMYYR